jgi:hypothetical protein
LYVPGDYTLVLSLLAACMNPLTPPEYQDGSRGGADCHTQRGIRSLRLPFFQSRGTTRAHDTLRGGGSGMV